jgi:predicted O-methyltransferase YrrM
MVPAWDKIRRAQAAGGTPEVIRRGLGRAKTSLRRSYKSPLKNLILLRVPVFLRADDAMTALAEILGEHPPAERDLALWRTEAESVLAQLPRREFGPFGPEFDLGPESAVLLYAVARWRRPRGVVETGVARGVSSIVLLSAISRNQGGALTSVDIDERAGTWVRSLFPEWQLTLLDPRRPTHDLARLLRECSSLSLFVHDSDHREDNQKAEYELAGTHLVEGGLLFSDDVDASPAFMSYLEQRGCAGIVILDDRKAVGIAVPSVPRLGK